MGGKFNHRLVLPSLAPTIFLIFDQIICYPQMLKVLSLLLFLSVFQNEKLRKVEVTDNISMLLPEGFRAMTDDEIAAKYLTTKRPLALFTDYSQAIDLGINKAVTRWRNQDLEIMKSFQKSNIYSLYDKVDMLKEGTREINGRQYAYFEFVSEVKPEVGSLLQKSAIQNYTYIQYTIINNESMVINFTCPARMKLRCSEMAQKIMESVQIKKGKQ